MKFETEHIIEALKDSNIPNESIDEVIHKLGQIADELQKEKEAAKTPKVKKKYALLHINNTASYYVIQAEADDTLADVPVRLNKAIGDYNQSAKKKKMEIKNYADAIEFIPNKILRNANLNIKTKEPCDVKDIPQG